MNAETEKAYWHIRNGGAGFYEQPRGLIAVWGKEAVQFLDGMITNDVKTLEDGQQMLAAFPNAQGRLLAVVRVLREGDRFLIETEATTREKVFQNLFRFTFAGDFFVEDRSDNYICYELINATELKRFIDNIVFSGTTECTFVRTESASEFRQTLASNSTTEINDELYETLRIEHSIPRYGVDMDETTVVPELGIDNLISYNKGCYIGQEIIARIHFRGHVAKQLTGLVLSEPPAVAGGLTSESNKVASETLALQSADGKAAGRITSVTYSPALEKTIALGYVRYDNLAKDTKLFVGETEATVVGLPFEV